MAEIEVPPVLNLVSSETAPPGADLPDPNGKRSDRFVLTNSNDEKEKGELQLLLYGEGLPPANVSGPRRLGQYLTDVTLGKVGSSTHGNKYPVFQGEPQTVQLTEPATGRPTPIADTVNVYAYEPTRSLYSGVSIDTTKRIPDPLAEDTVGFGKTWQKGESKKSDVQDGHELVARAPESGSPVRAYTSAILTNNRFSTLNRLNPTVGTNVPPNAMFNPSIRLPDPDERVRSLGKYSTGVRDTSFNNLAKIGVILSLRGTGEVGAGSNNYNPYTAGEELKAVIPSPTQLGVSRPEWTTLEAADVLRLMSDNDIPEGSMISIAKTSWGAMNNVYDPFDGVTATGMPVLAFGLSLAIIAATELLSVLVGAIGGGKPVEDPGGTKHKNGRHVFGHYQTNLPPKQPESSLIPKIEFKFQIGGVSELLGIYPTQHAFSDALRRGVSLFFGIDTSVGGLLGAGIGAAASTVGLGGIISTPTPSAPGYNVVAARAILRSTLTIVDSFGAVASSPNFIAGVKNFLAIFEVIKRSKLISAINVFLRLGDAALREKAGNQVDHGDGLSYTSEIDAIGDDSPSASITKSKLKAGTLAWAGNRTRSTMIMPLSIYSLHSTFLANKQNSGLSLTVSPASKNSIVYVDDLSTSETLQTGRIPNKGLDQTSVEKIEAELESEYVPFYFHDIRTNEIISFHAFLGGLTDDYAPSWESGDYYGRIDQVSIYKATARKISINFWIVSTSEDDFNEMWTKINKLVTLVYPQFSRGRSISTGTGDSKYTFIQPFSQIPTSSPIIRLRIGDVIKSNYSKFGIARIFGLNEKDAVLEGKNNASYATFERIQGIKLGIERILKEPWTSGPADRFILNTDGMNPQTVDGSINISIPIVGSGGDISDTNFVVPSRHLQYYHFKAVKKLTNLSELPLSLSNDQQTSGIFEADVMQVHEMTELYGISVKNATQIFREILDYNKSESSKVLGKQYVIPTSAISLSLLSLRQKFVDGTASSIAVNDADKLAKFLDASNNAIVKAFEETSGKGIAGKIDSLNFDWLTGTTWMTDKPGSKAPGRVKVTMSFSVIHDIAPGLDASGFNRAPNYGVGPNNATR
jgi:hypothetical protein